MNCRYPSMSFEGQYAAYFCRTPKTKRFEKATNLLKAKFRVFEG